jgi:hypothetical protein
MKKFAYLMILALASASIVRAQQVSEQQAYETALQFLSAQGGSAMRAPSRDGSPKLSLDYQARTGRKTDLYVYNRDGGGFVIVSADARTVKPVLGYSDSGSIDPDNIPPALQEILSGYQEQIEYARVNMASQKGVLRSAEPMGTPVVGPLIKTKWNQDDPYNRLCPKVNGVKAYTGCVATAMAQIMNYWRWPECGTGSHRDNNADTLFADFGQSVYDWDNMAITYKPDSSQFKIDAVSRLMYDCGISLNTMYEEHVSNVYDFSIVPSFINYLNYSVDIRKIKRNDYEAEWDSILIAELDAARPILYSGFSTDGSGHAFICDGYDSEHYFHYNIGWGGSFDGYYLSTAINLTKRHFNYNQGAVIGIFPDYNDEYREGMPVCFLDDDGNAVLSDVIRYRDSVDLIISDSARIGNKVYPVKSIAKNAFCYRSNGCKCLIIPETVENIGYGAFLCFMNVSDLHIPGSVKSIGKASFACWTSLESITVDESNQYYYVPEGSNVLMEIGTGYLVRACNNSILPIEEITIIGENAFDFLDSLRVLHFPNVTTIEDDAFAECHNLCEVSFGASISTIGERIFRGCNSLKDIYFYSDAAPVITSRSIPAGVTIHVKPSALDSYSTSDWSAYTIVADIDDATSVPAAPAAEQAPIYHDLLGCPVTTPQGMTIRDGAVWYNF